jgi:pimeloyl-ACP methyl ester carboxylesterase
MRRAPPGRIESGVDASIRLRDGRSLSYAIWGPSGGAPVFGFHGGGLSRLQHYGADAPARANVRLVLADRPGSGRSDPHPGSTLLDWTDDVAQLADALEIDRFAVFGVSAGGPGTAACGYALAPRVAAVGLVSAVGPYVDEPELLRTLRPEARALVELALRDPEAAVERARVECEAQVRMLAHPEELLDRQPPGTPVSDRTVLSDPEIRARFAAAFRETAAQGAAGVLHDTLLHYVRPWGFPLAEIHVPVFIWHGARDPFVPVEAARLVARRIPGASLCEYACAGHAVDYAHIDEILGTLARALSRPLLRTSA